MITKKAGRTIVDIVGLGTVAMDVILQVDSLPKEDGFALVKHKNYLDGGSATNVIVQASRLGVSCGFIAQISDDDIGIAIKKGLDQENVDTKFMSIKKSGTSLHTTIVVGEQGEKFILLNMGDAFLTLDCNSVDIDFIKSASIFYTDLLPGKAALYALKEAKKAGLKTVFNLQIGIPLMEQLDVTKADILAALPYVDVFAPCKEAFAQLTGTVNYTEKMGNFQKFFEGLLLVTLGSQGSAAAINNQIVTVPVYDVEVTDTTGAGDSYIGAFMYAYFIKQLQLAAAMKFSSVCAAITCTNLGARSSPHINQVEKILYSGV
ncbi:MAG TPA: carbohydrate kinase family protein [Negativicutes bacterium]